jgi:hypothetical protein
MQQALATWVRAIDGIPDHPYDVFISCSGCEERAVFVAPPGHGKPSLAPDLRA